MGDSAVDLLGETSTVGFNPLLEFIGNGSKFTSHAHGYILECSAHGFGYNL